MYAMASRGIDVSEVRKRLRAAIEEHRRAAVSRQGVTDAASADYEQFLSTVATPVVQTLANVLRAEGFSFTVFTPRSGLRLASSKYRDDYIEFSLDTSAAAPTVLLNTSRARGRRLVRAERPLRDGAAISELTEEDVLRGLLEEIAPLVER